MDYHYIRISIIIYYRHECKIIFYVGLSYIFFQFSNNKIIWRSILFNNHKTHIFHTCTFESVHLIRQLSIIQITKSLDDPVTKYKSGGLIFNMKAIRWIDGIRVADRRVGSILFCQLQFHSIPFGQFHIKFFNYNCINSNYIFYVLFFA